MASIITDEILTLERTLLIIEDDLGLQKQLKWCFEGFDVFVAGDRSEALKLLRLHNPSVVTLDLGLPPDADGVTEGFATLEEILAEAPHTKVIMLTSNDEQDNALHSIKLGAYDYCQKPFNEQDLALIVQRAFNLAALEKENRRLARQLPNYIILDGIVAASPQMLSVCQTIEKIAPTDITVLLLGESGTGKEVLAQALHTLSTRSERRFVAINCASIPESLLESELFGYEKGAFTGAAKTTIGKIEYANGGTLFLDEAGDLPYPLQAKLLRFLQERVIERVGGRAEIPVDVRVICATNQDLPIMIENGKFREDLYYRMNEICIQIPPLRERDGDILLLAKSFVNHFSQEYNKRIKGFTVDAIKAMESYQWPGNVRELMSKIKRAILLEDGVNLTANSLELEECENDDDMQLNLKQAKVQIEEMITRKALSIHNGNISKAAEVMGVSRPTLYALMEKYKIEE